jgi:hypothetical protein
MHSLKTFLFACLFTICLAVEGRVGTGTWGHYPQVLRFGDDILVRGYFDPLGNAAADDYALISRSTGMVQLMAGEPSSDVAGVFPQFTVDETGFFGGVAQPVDATAFAIVEGKSGLDGLSILGDANGLVLSGNDGLLASKYAPTRHATRGVAANALVSVGHAAGSLGSNLEDVLVLSELSNLGQVAEAGVQAQETADRELRAVLTFSDNLPGGLIDPQPVDFGDNGSYFVALFPEAGGNSVFGLFQVAGIGAGETVNLVASHPLEVVAERLLFAPLARDPGQIAAIAFRPGETVHPVVHFSSTKVVDHGALTLDNGLEAVAMEIVPLGDPTEEPRLLVVDATGEAFVLEWINQFENSSVLETLGFPSAGDWAGAIADPVTGGFALLVGKSGQITGLQTVAYDGSGYTLTATGSQSFRRPALAAGVSFGFIQAVVYDAKPFAEVGAMPIEVYQAGDWGSSPSVPGGSALALDVETFGGSGSGLENPGTSTVGSLPTGAVVTNVATNQWDPTISLWFGKASGAALSPTVSLFPDPVNVQELAFQPEVSVLPGGDIYFRYGGTGTFTMDGDGILPAIVEDTLVEVFAVDAGTGLPGPLLRVDYTFSNSAVDRDSDGDGLPDALEAALDSEPYDEDCDGDSIPDAVELFLDMADGVFDNDINTADSGAFTSAEIAEAQALMGRGRAAFDLTVIGQRVLDGFEVGIDGFSQDFGDLASVESQPAGGLLLVQDATGGILSEESQTLRGPTFRTPAVDLPGPNQFLTMSTGATYDPAPWDRTFGGQPMRSDFDGSAEGWCRQRTLVTALGLLLRENGDRALASPISSSPEAWNGTEWAVDYLGSGLNRIYGLRAEISLRSGGAPAYLHFVLERQNTSTGVTTAWVSAGQRVEAGLGNWQEVRILLDEATFTKVSSGTETFETVLRATTAGSVIKRVGFVLSDGLEVAVDGAGLPTGSATHPGFYIDRIRPIGLPGSGQRMLATIPTPDIELATVPFNQTGATLDAKLNAWVADYLAAQSAISGGAVEVSVASTVTSLLFEQVLNARSAIQLASLPSYEGNYRFVAPALLPAELGGFPTAHGTTNEPVVDTALAGFSLDELEFLRYPSVSESLALSSLVGMALDPQALLRSLDADVQPSFDAAGLDALGKVAVAVYQAAASFGSTNPGALGSPVQVLRAILADGFAGLPDPVLADDAATEVAFRWKAALAATGIDEATVDAAQSIAAGYVASALGEYRAMRAATVTVGSGLGDLTDAGAFTYELVDRDGNPFPMPQDFYFPSGSELSISGYQRSQSGSHFVLEVTEMQVLSIPRTSPLDTDGNLLDDTWELAFLGAVGADPYADPDGDGLNNLSEFIGGTDPNRQPTSYSGGSVPSPVNWPTPLRIERQSSGDFWIILPMPLSQADEFSWVVEVSNDLQAFATASSVVESNGTSEQVFVIPAAAFAKAFWRLKAELQ